jgi:predicted amidohydrolase YtcJ
LIILIVLRSYTLCNRHCVLPVPPALISLRRPAPTRIEALCLYTQGSTWFSFEESARGAFAVLSRDYFSVPIEQIGGTVSLLTMVGGRIVYADGPYAALEAKAR